MSCHVWQGEVSTFRHPLLKKNRHAIKHLKQVGIASRPRVEHFGLRLALVAVT